MERQCLGEKAIEMWKMSLKCLHRTSLYCHKKSPAVGTPMSKADQLHLVGMSLGDEERGRNYSLFYPQRKKIFSRKQTPLFEKDNLEA